MFTCPTIHRRATTHQTDKPSVRQPTSPTTHLSDKPLIRQNYENQEIKKSLSDVKKQLDLFQSNNSDSQSFSIRKLQEISNRLEKLECSVFEINNKLKTTTPVNQVNPPPNTFKKPPPNTFKKSSTNTFKTPAQEKSKEVKTSNKFTKILSNFYQI